MTVQQDYERLQLTITEFDSEDAIITSGFNYKQDTYETRGVTDDFLEWW